MESNKWQPRHTGRVGVRSQRSEDAVTAEGDEIGVKVHGGAAGSAQSPYKVVVAVTESGQLSDSSHQ